jgi:hypothetical protein
MHESSINIRAVDSSSVEDTGVAADMERNTSLSIEIAVNLIFKSVTFRSVRERVQRKI